MTMIENVLQQMLCRSLRILVSDESSLIGKFVKEHEGSLTLCYKTAPTLALGERTALMAKALEELDSLRASPQFKDISIEFCFFQGEDVKKLRMAGIDSGRKLLACTRRRLEKIKVSKSEIERYLRMLRSFNFELK